VGTVIGWPVTLGVENEVHARFDELHEAGKALKRRKHAMLIRIAGTANIEFRFLRQQGHWETISVRCRWFANVRP